MQIHLQSLVLYLNKMHDLQETHQVVHANCMAGFLYFLEHTGIVSDRDIEHVFMCKVIWWPH